MSHRTVLGLTGGCLLALALGACTANGPTEAGDAAAAPAPTFVSTPTEETKAASPSGAPLPHTHEHPATSAPETSGGSGSTSKPPSTTAPKPTPPRLYFKTPQAAMRYLAAAYNRNDVAALKHVTTPPARAGLLGMRSVAENLRLVGCKVNAGRGDYLCEFHHDDPKGTPRPRGRSHGYAHFTAAPADKYGWYMTILNDCG